MGRWVRTVVYWEELAYLYPESKYSRDVMPYIGHSYTTLSAYGKALEQNGVVLKYYDNMLKRLSEIEKDIEGKDIESMTRAIEILGDKELLNKIDLYNGLLYMEKFLMGSGAGVIYEIVELTDVSNKSRGAIIDTIHKRLKQKINDLRQQLLAESINTTFEIGRNLRMEGGGEINIDMIFEHSRSRRLYEEILKLYPKRPENGGILYQLARGYMEEGELNKSNRMLERIIKEFPDGKYSQEAAFRLGEYYFSLNDKPKAISYYRQALKGDDSSLNEKSLYKLGWAFFQSKDYEGAADMFMALLQRKGISLTPEGKEEIGEISIIERDMVWDSINTLVLVFDYMGDPSKIANYFKVRGVQEFEPYVYRKLGDIYLNTGRFKEAADVYEAFVNTNPLHEDAPVFQSKIIEAYTRGNMVDLAYNSRIKFVESYMEDSIWFKSNRRMAQKRIKDLVDYNKGLIKTDMYNLAKFHYSNARSSNKKDDYFEAILWIRRFIDIFPQEPESINLRYMLVEVNFIYAEIYSELKEYEKALAEYEKVAYKYQPSPFSAEAGYKILFYLEKLAKPSGKMR